MLVACLLGIALVHLPRPAALASRPALALRASPRAGPQISRAAPAMPSRCAAHGAHLHPATDPGPGPDPGPEPAPLAMILSLTPILSLSLRLSLSLTAARRSTRAVTMSRCAAPVMMSEFTDEEREALRLPSGDGGAAPPEEERPDPIPNPNQRPDLTLSLTAGP
eukprot:scaffold20894_cov41-Phaeocystis_antarctica.AAC.1